MIQTQDMADFMHRLLKDPGLEQLRVPGLAVKFRVEAGQGDDRAAALRIGQTKDEIQSRHKEVDVGDPQDYPVFGDADGRQRR